MSNRVYGVISKEDGKIKALIRAQSPNTARGVHAKSLFDARTLTSDEVIDAVEAGLRPINAYGTTPPKAGDE
jgi:hypothetical protein